MCQLCKIHEIEGDKPTKIEFFCFNLSEDVEDMLDEFHVLMEVVKPDLICKLWKTAVDNQFKALTAGEKSPDLTFKEVHSYIWRPIYHECEDTIEQLSKLHLPLHKVKDYYFPYNTKAKLQKELNKLCDAINNCRKSKGQAVLNNLWIQDAASRIFTYKQLCQCRGAAETFLKLRNTLGLTGDFAVVEALSKAVSLLSYLINKW